MPELPEVHRAAHFLRHYLVEPGPHILSRVSYYSPPDNKNAATATSDPKIFETAKTGTDAAKFCKALQGRKVKDVGRLGKYFWLQMESPPHPLFHFGMTGWVKYKGAKGKGVDFWEGKTEGRKSTSRDQKDGKDPSPQEGNGEERPHEVPEEEWPPRFTKLLFEAISERGEVTEFAFVDGRRFSKVLLVHPKNGIGIRETEPLSLNGPDPVLEADRITISWLTDQVAKRKVPIKAFLLDQHALSGVGNWVADEVLFHAGIHPEANAHTLEEEQIQRLTEQLKNVCKVAAIDALGDSQKFPDGWLMRHRWRLDKTANKGELPNGEEIRRITVGGRTSAFVPSRQGSSANTKVNPQTQKEMEPATQPAKKRKASRMEGEDERGDARDGVAREPTDKGSRSKRSSARATQMKKLQTTDSVLPKADSERNQLGRGGQRKVRERRY